MSCSHYLRKCKLLAPCCNKEYLCRICHDENEDHALDRKTVENIVCVQCHCKQDISRNCCDCGILFGKYTCLTCRLFDDTEKQQFHCAGCGICRVGGRDNFFHCQKCNICISTNIRETHKCVEDMSRRKCPVCLEDLHSSRKTVDIPDCSHMIHKECLSSMLSYGKTSCPICYKSLIDMRVVWESYDNSIVNTEMPEIYRNYYVNILCRDCHEESKAIFHVVGLKCGGCGGYNTTRIGGDDPFPEESPSISVENLSVTSDDSLSSWETVYTEEDETNRINVNDSDASITLLPHDESNRNNSNETVAMRPVNESDVDRTANGQSHPSNLGN